MNRFPQVNVVAQSSPERCFSDEEYESAGITVQQDVSDCDVLLGIKEIPTEYLIPHKTYFFFSHTIKKQPYNQKMLQDIIRKGIRLVDYETLKWENGQRVLGKSVRGRSGRRCWGWCWTGWRRG